MNSGTLGMLNQQWKATQHPEVPNSTGSQHWCVLLTPVWGLHCALTLLGSVFMNPLRVGSGFRRGESSNKVIFIALSCCEYLLIIAFITEHSTWWHVSSVQPHGFTQSMLYSLSTQTTSSCPTVQSGLCKKVTPHYQHRGLRGNLQVTANRLKTFSAVRRTKYGFGICLGETKLIFAAKCFLQRSAMDRNPSGTESKPSDEESNTRALPASSGPQGGNPLYQATLIHGQPN